MSKVIGKVKDYNVTLEGIDPESNVVEDCNHNLIVANPKDTIVSSVIMRTGIWEKNINYLIDKLVKPGDTILNLGTHIGFHTIHMSKIIEENGTIYAFEANPKTYKYLLANLYFNNITNVIPFNYAVFSNNTELSFVGLDDYLNQGASYVQAADGNNLGRMNHPYWQKTKLWEKGDHIIVPGVKLDDVLNFVSHVDVIQMDIEGCEAEAMYGAVELLARSPNAVIIQEWTPSYISEHSNISEYITFWQDKGYEIAKIPHMAPFQLRPATALQLQRMFEEDIVIAHNMTYLNELLM